MSRFLAVFAAAAISMTPQLASAQGTIKIGVIMPFRALLADTATQMDGGMKLYMQRHGDTVAGKKIEIIRRDTGGIAPDVARRLAQELVVREGVDILTGLRADPERARGSLPVSEQARKPMVIMNAATSIVTDQVALCGARVDDPAADHRAARRLGVPQRHPQRHHHGLGLCARPRRRAGLPARLQGGGRRDRRCDPHAGEQCRFLGLCAAREGLRTRRPCSCSCRPDASPLP